MNADETDLNKFKLGDSGTLRSKFLSTVVKGETAHLRLGAKI
jgi:hypothetical protein